MSCTFKSLIDLISFDKIVKENSYRELTTCPAKTPANNHDFGCAVQQMIIVCNTRH